MLLHTNPKRGGPKKWKLIVLLTACLAGFSPLSATPLLETDSPLATAGYFRLSWVEPGKGVYHLQQARHQDFRDAQTIYRGPDQATVISGLADGDYYYRILKVGVLRTSTWSEPIKVEVRHHPLSRAFAFFALGAIIFIITLVVLIRGCRQAKT